MTSEIIWPIFVPSYGRAEKSQTIKSLIEEGFFPNICVESNEVNLYSEAYPGCLVFANKASPKSISGARQSILEYARLKDMRWYWQIDDTVNGISVRKVPHGRARKLSWFESLLGMQKLVQINPKIAMVSSDYGHTAAFAEEPWKLNTRCMAIVGARTDTQCNYDTALGMKEDIDFCITTIQKGFLTILSHLHVQRETDMGKNKKGGMVEKYAQKSFHLKACFELVKKWPGIVRIDKMRNGRPEIKVAWNKLGKGESKNGKSHAPETDDRKDPELH